MPDFFLKIIRCYWAEEDVYIAVLPKRPPQTMFPLTLIVIVGADLWLGVRMLQSSSLHLLLALVFCFFTTVQAVADAVQFQTPV